MKTTLLKDIRKYSNTEHRILWWLCVRIAILLLSMAFLDIGNMMKTSTRISFSAGASWEITMNSPGSKDKISSINWKAKRAGP